MVVNGGWSAQSLTLSVGWYQDNMTHTAACFVEEGYPVSGDATAFAKANPPIFCPGSDSPRSPSAPFARVNPR
jgi:hypothetical protein